MAQGLDVRRPLAIPLPRHLEEPQPGDARPTVELGVCLVTGAAGYLGRHLVTELLWSGHRVRGFDRSPLDLRDPQLEFVQGDVRSYEDVRKVCEGIDTVFHTAAVLDFARFPTARQREASHAVNVRGVQNIVRAAREAGAARLVHTSSNNVTLDGPVIDGDETRPYATRARDLYTVTKVLGEQAALAGNGEGKLLTCAIRPGGIYGPGETLVFPRVIDECAGGRYIVIVGDGSALSDNTFIENLVDGHIEAARHLLSGSPVCGQAYFITDDAPINYFDFFRPVIEALGFRHPTRRVPGAPLQILMAGWEFLHRMLGPLGMPRPPLLALEVKKIVVSHYNRIDKARRDFGWRPRVSTEQALARCIEPCRRLLAERETLERPHWGWWIAIPAGMGWLGVLALSPAAHGAWQDAIGPWTPRPLLLAIFAWAVGLHIWKGLRAVQLAERLGLRRTALAWGWQTFLLGFASLRLLERRAERMRSDGRGLKHRRMLNIRWLLALITSIHRRVYLASRGRIGHRALRFRFLLLGCVGRRSGRERVAPLLYVEEESRFVVVGSNAGDTRDPAWWFNLRARPDAWAQVGGERFAVRAREARPEEAEKIWPQIYEAYGGYEEYRGRAGRPIPLVLLERV